MMTFRLYLLLVTPFFVSITLVSCQGEIDVDIEMTQNRGGLGYDEYGRYGAVGMGGLGYNYGEYFADGGMAAQGYGEYFGGGGNGPLGYVDYFESEEFGPQDYGGYLGGGSIGFRDEYGFGGWVGDYREFGGAGGIGFGFDEFGPVYGIDYGQYGAGGDYKDYKYFPEPVPYRRRKRPKNTYPGRPIYRRRRFRYKPKLRRYSYGGDIDYFEPIRRGIYYESERFYGLRRRPYGIYRRHRPYSRKGKKKKSPHSW